MYLDVPEGGGVTLTRVDPRALLVATESENATLPEKVVQFEDRVYSISAASQGAGVEGRNLVIPSTPKKDAQIEATSHLDDPMINARLAGELASAHRELDALHEAYASVENQRESSLTALHSQVMSLNHQLALAKLAVERQTQDKQALQDRLKFIESQQVSIATSHGLEERVKTLEGELGESRRQGSSDLKRLMAQLDASEDRVKTLDDVSMRYQYVRSCFLNFCRHSETREHTYKILKEAFALTSEELKGEQ